MINDSKWNLYTLMFVVLALAKEKENATENGAETVTLGTLIHVTLGTLMHVTDT